MKPVIQAYANNDDAMIVWQVNKKIANCYGFALYRKYKGESDAMAEPIQSYVGFEDQNPKEGETRPSTDWPFQKFVWSDFFVKTGDIVSYKAVPMIWQNNKLIKDEANSSDWSNEITIETGEIFKASFNRGLISSQFLVNRLGGAKDGSKKLDKILADENSKTRAFLGGNLSYNIYRLLDDVANDSSLVIYAALYELNEPTLRKKLKVLKKRANVILANGAFSSKDPDPSSEARGELENIINLSDRMVSGKHFAHNKFLVICKKNGSGDLQPVRTLTGSTNWSINGLFTQINNGIIIEDKTTAEYYFNEWQEIKKAADNYPPDFITQNSTVKENKNLNIRTWFTPVKNLVDMEEARTLIENARKGILFLMFNPGPAKTLFNAILDKNRQDINLFVHGVINQDPGGEKHPLIFVNRGNLEPTDFNAIIPRNISLGNRFSQKEIAGRMVRIHSKVILIDAFSDNPVLLTGSHNLGEKASQYNDDNLNIIKGDKKLAEEYSVHIMSVYNHYRYRYFQYLNQGNNIWNGLKYTDTWQDSYLSGLKKREIDFWHGK
jgi:phosphatidylserine/phosphatidylglycerophosphate/cardiolipin synthase-like enzyme